MKEGSSTSSGTFSRADGLEERTLASVIVVCSLVMGADLAMFAATMKALEEYFSIDPMSLGFVLLLQGLAQALTAPIWGMFADRQDRLLLLYVSLLGISCMTFLTGISVSFPMLCVARLFTGLFGAGLGPISQSMLASAVQPDERGKFIGYFVVANTLGSCGGAVYAASFSHVMMFEVSGWRFTFILMSFVTFFIGVSMYVLNNFLNETLIRALVTSPGEAWNMTVGASDFMTIISRNSFLVLLAQGAFASTFSAAGGFLIEIFQYAGFEDFQASTLAGLISLGSIVGALGSGYFADQCAKLDPAKGRILYGLLGNCVCVTLLLAMAFGDVDTILNTRHYYGLGAICFITGVFQLFAYVGAVKPILSEIVPRRLAGQAYAYAAGIDGAIAALAGAPVLATIAQKVFDYQPTGDTIATMDSDLRRNNLMALARAYFFVTLVCHLSSSALFTMLIKTYQPDKETSAKENGEYEQKALLEKHEKTFTQA